jgi:hypothetical protein
MSSAPASLSRRASLRRLILAALAPLSGCSRPPAPVKPAPVSHLGVIIGPGQYVQDERKRFVLSVVDLDHAAQPPRTIPLDFFAHGVVPDPVEPRRLVLFEKIGKGACEVDLVDRRVTRKVETVTERLFYGHGAFTPDGKTLFSTETEVDANFKGMIAVRDGKTFQLLDAMPTYGAAPHDCQLIDGGKTLVVTNGGAAMDKDPRPSVTYVDLASKKLLDRLEFETPLVNAGHLALTSTGDLAVVSAPREGLPGPADKVGCVSLRRGDQALRTMQQPAGVTQRLRGEVLSVCIHEATGVVACTCPLGDLVTFWDLKGLKYIKSMEYRRPRGVALTLDLAHFVVSYGEGEMVMISADKLEPEPELPVARSLLTGSHIIPYELPA